MTDVDEKRERRAAAKMLLHALRSQEQRDLIAKTGHRSGQPVIVVLDSDTLGEVIGRIVNERVDPPVVVAMYRPADQGIVIWTFGPLEAVTAAMSDGQRAGHLATIGMLYDTMVANGEESMDVVLSAVGPTRMHAAELAGC
jgi:hypothetical protein